ncbi:MAG TPA: hypothetical protein PLZ84_07025 [Clostridia bacterium]|nr:hypothetical protein [Clostridia bacterium]
MQNFDYKFDEYGSQRLPEQEYMQMAPYAAVFPEIYYKLQPLILMACDQIDPMGPMPSQDMLDQIADGIYEDMMQLYPEMSDYIRQYETQQVPFVPGRPPFFRRRFRRRGPFRDIIDILLFLELLRRRRRPF